MAETDGSEHKDPLRPGQVDYQVTIISNTGKAIPIAKGQIIELNIYQELLVGAFLTGNVTFNDSFGFIQLLPFIGEERINISINSAKAEAPFIGSFYIYKLDSIKPLADRTQSYTIHFISEEAIYDINKRLSKSFKGDISDMVKELLSGERGLESKKKLNIESPSNKTMFISNFWNPMKCISYLCKTSINDNDSPSYIFYEDFKGLNFVTLDKLYKGSNDGNAALMKFVWDKYTAAVSPGGGSSTNLVKDYMTVLEYEQPIAFDFISNLKSGMYGSEIIYYDILTQQYVHNFYQPDWKKEEHHLNDKPLWTNKNWSIPKGKLVYGKQYYNNFNGYDSSTANTKIIQKWMSTMGQAEGYRCKIRVYGRVEYNVGQKVWLGIPKRSVQVESPGGDNLDRKQSGYYLINSICHQISPQGHFCNMELIKDSYLTEG